MIPFLNSPLLGGINARIISAKSNYRYLYYYEIPVANKFISIKPVVGSVAALYVATLIKRNASSTSSPVTSSDKRILASDSEIRINDSNYLVVDVMTLLFIPSFLIST